MATKDRNPAGPSRAGVPSRPSGQYSHHGSLDTQFDYFEASDTELLQAIGIATALQSAMMDETKSGNGAQLYDALWALDERLRAARHYLSAAIAKGEGGRP